MRRIIMAALLLALTLCLPGAALAQDEGLTVSGRVVSDTEAGAPLGGIEVALYSYAGGSLSTVATAVTGEAGDFNFGDVAAGPQYVVSAAYQELDYYQPVIFAPGATETFVEVHVVAATDSDAAVSVAMRHVIIDFDEAAPLVTEICRVSNGANATFVRDVGSLVFTLPPGAVPLNELTDYEPLGDGRLRYRQPLPPGPSELVYGYSLPPAADGSYDIVFTADYPTANLEVLLSGEDIEVVSPDLAPTDPVTAGDGRLFLHYARSDLARGDTFSLAVRRAPAGGYAWLGWTLLTLVVILAAWAVRRARRRGGA